MDLDNANFVKGKDPSDALGVIAASVDQLEWEAVVEGDIAAAPIANVVLAGMGGSALGGLIAQDWLELVVPFTVVRDYALPPYVDDRSLVIVSSFSGNTEETLACLNQAKARGSAIAVITAGGKLLDIARAETLPFVALATVPQPRYSVIEQLRAIAKIVEGFGLVKGKYDEIATLTQPMKELVASLTPDIPRADNPAKQLAEFCAGKTPIIYASSQFGSIAYKWKISFNENAKNTAWCGALPEFNHNEFIGWASHPVEKPFAVLDLRSDLDAPRIGQRFELSAKLLSGRRPAPREIWLRGETVLEQMLYGVIVADFVSIYLGILNGVDPTPVELVEKLKKELG